MKGEGDVLLTKTVKLHRGNIVRTPLVGVIFLRWDLKTSCIKNSEYKPQAKTKMIPIVISTISHFWSPTLTIYGSMYLYHYFAWYIQPPTYKYFLL